MKRLPSTTVIFFLVGLFAPQQAHAALAPSLVDQVREVTQWFTGNFDNSEQVSRNPSVPLITLSTCPVQLENSIEPSGTQNLYLAQPALNRFRLYSFEPANSGVNLGIRSFVNPGSLSGICGQPVADRVVNQENVINAVCNVFLVREPNRYTGSNAPTGCPTSTGGKVVSNVAFQPDSTLSFDQIFSSNGQLIAATPIEFRRVEPVPEPTTVTGLVISGCGLIWLRRKRSCP